MSCICQYYAPGLDSNMDQVAFPLATDEETPSENIIQDAEKESSEMTVSASDLADCRAENWLLKKKLMDYEVTIENLEQLVNIIVDKQHRILSEMFQLSKENRELQTECHLQREYHSMERNALMKQLHDVQTLSRNRSMELGSGSIEKHTNDRPEGLVEAEIDTCIGEESSGTEEEFSTEEMVDQDETDDEHETAIEYDSYEDQDSDADDEDYDALSATSSPKTSAPTSRSSSPSSTGSESGDSDAEAAKCLDYENEQSNSDSDTD
ncbi:uncharacterized protein LOC111081522 [Drosophila obscura]|uniref:uncharacterized protein LOC111081522 n=1 Tax=Drosophila obscura TaxID=7282 RepID=UPI000BA0C7A5|nr:uncharacterized protein LOC111081522 [Drosophila obscura]